MKKFWLAFKNVWKYVFLVFMILLTFSYAMFQGGFVSWFLFYSFMPFALYCLAIIVYSLNELNVSRHLQKMDFNAGEPLKVMISVRRKYPFPLFYLIVEDQLSESLMHLPKQKILLFPGFKKEFSCDYTISELPRGEHFFHAFKLRVGDPLGLLVKEKIFMNEEKIIVYPVYSEILYRPFENHYDQGMTASRERVQRDTSMAIGVREYQPGDRFSWINWKATAKRNDIMTKEFEQRQSHDVFVVMDCAPDLHFESIVSFTASLLHAVLKKRGPTRAFDSKSGESQLSHSGRGKTITGAVLPFSYNSAKKQHQSAQGHRGRTIYSANRFIYGGNCSNIKGTY
jgi:uncharacterized protein (DUF58 family)